MKIRHFIKTRIEVPKIAWVTLTCILFVNVLLAVLSASKGSELYMLEQKKVELEKEKILLKSQLVVKSSLFRIQDEALALGMKKQENVV